MSTQTKTSHTPGPWRADRNVEGDWEIHAATEHSELSFWIATVHAETPKEQTEANARLIAAAPELLEIARRALEYAPNEIEANKCRAAIAKAEGMK